MNSLKASENQDKMIIREGMTKSHIYMPSRTRQSLTFCLSLWNRLHFLRTADCCSLNPQSLLGPVSCCAFYHIIPQFITLFIIRGSPLYWTVLKSHNLAVHRCPRSLGEHWFMVNPFLWLYLWHGVVPDDILWMNEQMGECVRAARPQGWKEKPTVKSFLCLGVGMQLGWQSACPSWTRSWVPALALNKPGVEATPVMKTGGRVRSSGSSWATWGLFC